MITFLPNRSRRFPAVVARRADRESRIADRDQTFLSLSIRMNAASTAAAGLPLVLSG
jgi:hypothetical protein